MKSSHVLLHMSLIQDIGPAVIQNILNAFKDGELQRETLDHVYNFNLSDFMHHGKVGLAKATLLQKGLQDRQLLERELELIKKHDITLLTLIDSNYPERLKQIAMPPAVLYCKGAADLSYAKQLAIVGSRKGDRYGEMVIKSFMPELVSHDWTIVSGGALGIDTMAHSNAMQLGGTTIAVLGSGLLKPYPASNKNLFMQIVENGGAIVSPFPLMYESLPGCFPARNRIIAGLSLGCLVVQAAAKSGALITAQYALDAGRELAAVPGPIDNALSVGCHKLLSEGAAVAHSAQDLLITLGEKSTRAAAGKIDMPLVVESPTPPAPATPVGQLLALCAEPISFEELECKSGLPAAAVQELLWELMLDGKVSQTVLGFWQRTSLWL